MASKTDEKVKVNYQQDIITLEETFEKNLDFSQIPVFKIENCEILNSSLSAPTPKFGHNIQIMLPADTNFTVIDRTIRQNYLANMQQENPNLEFVKGSLTMFSKKDFLDGKTDEKNVGRSFVNINVSNSYMFDRTIDGEGKEVDKKIGKIEESTSGNVIVKYFRVIDQFSGKGIEPEIFKYVNGEKNKSFISPKTKQETPLYLNRGDIVNIELRPFGVKNKKTGELSLRYNLLTVEIVQTAWDRGIGRTAGSGKRVQEAPDSVNAESLSSIFGGIAQVQNVAKTQQTVQQPTVTASTPAPQVAQAQVMQDVQQTIQPVVQAQPQTPPVQQATPVIDFSALANLDISSVNLGE